MRMFCLLVRMWHVYAALSVWLRSLIHRRHSILIFYERVKIALASRESSACLRYLGKEFRWLHLLSFHLI